MAKVKSLCVYCGSSNKVNPSFLDIAFQFGRLLGRHGVQLVYGGGRVGMMGRLADGCLAEGGRVVGIIPHHLHDFEIAHQGVSELHLVDTMHERKRLMAETSDAFAVLPGGYGTLDEMFEIVTWRQLGLHDKPIVLANLNGYWNRLQSVIALMAEEGFVSRTVRFFEVVDTIGAILPALESVPAPALGMQADRF